MSFEIAVFQFQDWCFLLLFSAKRQDEDYDEQVEETLQDEVGMKHQHQSTKQLQVQFYFQHRLVVVFKWS